LKTTFHLLLCALSFGALSLGANSASASLDDPNCYRDVCVGDRAYNVSRDYREVTVVGIDNFGKFVVRFEDNGGVGGNWDREDLALERGCAGDLCVGYPAINVSRDYRAVKVVGIQWNNRLVLRFDDNAGVGGNWDRWDLAVAWGCVGNLCVNDTVYNRTNSRQATIAAIQTNQSGVQDRMVLNYGPSGLGGNWQLNDLVLLQRGPTAYPPGPPTPYCPPGTHYDPRTNRCESNLPPPPPVCPPGTHYDPALGRCVANLPPPPPVCPPGTHYDPRIGRCVANNPPPPMDWTCTIAKPGHTFTGHGPTRPTALQAALTGCARSGFACRESEAVCRL
jgi:hypothetical protein